MECRPARDATGGPEAGAVGAAVAALAAGHLVIVPTDTVYGLAADARDAAAVARLFAAKGRPPEKAIALLAASAEQAGEVADLTGGSARRLAARWWPGALTIVARSRVSLPAGVGTGGTVGVRVPDDAVVVAIAAGLGRPLAVTSANRSGDPAVSRFADAVREVGPWVAVALDGGDCPLGIASTVVDCTREPPVVLRAGGLTAADLELPGA